MIRGAGLLVTLLAASQAGTAEAQAEGSAASPDVRLSPIPDGLTDAWHEGDWALAQASANAHRAASPGDARARIVNAGVRLHVRPELVLRLDLEQVNAAFEEIGRIELQRTAAEAVGAVSALLGTGGLGVALVGLTFDAETFMQGGVAFPIAGGTVAAIAFVAALVATVCVIDVPFRWQRWIASLGRF